MSLRLCVLCNFLQLKMLKIWQQTTSNVFHGFMQTNQQSNIQQNRFFLFLHKPSTKQKENVTKSDVTHNKSNFRSFNLLHLKQLTVSTLFSCRLLKSLSTNSFRSYLARLQV